MTFEHRTCACGCGRPLPAGDQRYFAEACERRGELRQENSRPTTADRVRARHSRILEAPHRELDRELDLALQVDDDRERSRHQLEQPADEEEDAAA